MLLCVMTFQDIMALSTFRHAVYMENEDQFLEQIAMYVCRVCNHLRDEVSASQ